MARIHLITSKPLNLLQTRFIDKSRKGLILLLNVIGWITFQWVRVVIKAHSISIESIKYLYKIDLITSSKKQDHHLFSSSRSFILNYVNSWNVIFKDFYKLTRANPSRITKQLFKWHWPIKTLVIRYIS